MNPVRNAWQFIRNNWLSNQVFASYDTTVDHCCDAWNRLADQPWRVMTIGLRGWATGHATWVLVLDLDARSVAHARARYPGVRFETCDLTRVATPAPSHSMDVIVAIGLLHRLSNLQARAMLGLAKQALRPGSRVVTVGPAFEPGQHPVAALLARADRGCFIRSGEAYYELARAVFSHATLTTRHDLLRVPYTDAIVECRTR